MEKELAVSDCRSVGRDDCNNGSQEELSLSVFGAAPAQYDACRTTKFMDCAGSAVCSAVNVLSGNLLFVVGAEVEQGRRRRVHGTNATSSSSSSSTVF